MPETKTKQINASLLKLADVHLLAAVGEDVSQVYGRHSEYLTVMLRVLQAHGYTLEEVQRRWNEVSEGKK